MGLLGNQKGFSALEVALFVIVMGLVGGSGYYVVQRQNDTQDEKKQETVRQVKASTDEEPVVEKKIRVGYGDGSFELVVASAIAKSIDQRGVLEALSVNCGDGYVAGVANVVFTQKGEHPLFVREGNFASINASCHAADASNEEDGSGFRVYLQKTDGTWKVDFKTQDHPVCSKVDAKGYPAVVVPECYDENAGDLRNRQ